jgi:hypothetical protein
MSDKTPFEIAQEERSFMLFCRDCASSQGATGLVKDFDRLLEINQRLINKIVQEKTINEEYIDELEKFI